MTSTFQTVKAIGWDYIEKLGKQKVLQVQSATEPPKKLALGERAVSADGLEYMDIRMRESGAPIASSIRRKARRSFPAARRSPRMRRIRTPPSCS